MEINAVQSLQINKTNQNRQMSFGCNKNVFIEALDTFVKKQEQKAVQELNIAEKLKASISSIIENTNFINKGEHGEVFRVNDFWVIKLPINQKPVINSATLNTENMSAKLKTYYGDTIAQFGNVEVMKNAIGGSAEAIPAGVSRSCKTLQEQMKYYNDVYLEKFSNLPQSAYDNIAADFKELNRTTRNGKYLEFDTINPSNFVATDNEIKIMDELTQTSSREPNSVAKMLNVFTNSFDHETPAVFDMLATGRRKDIFKKCLLASEKAELPYGWSPQERSSLNEAMNLCGFQEDFSEVQRTLMNNRRKYSDMPERLKAAQEYLDNLGQEDLFYNTAHFFE